MVTKVDDTWYLAGIISSQFCGADGTPGIYTSVAAFEDWIAPIYNGGEPDRKDLIIYFV